MLKYILSLGYVNTSVTHAIPYSHLHVGNYTRWVQNLFKVISRIYIIPTNTIILSWELEVGNMKKKNFLHLKTTHFINIFEIQYLIFSDICSNKMNHYLDNHNRGDKTCLNLHSCKCIPRSYLYILFLDQCKDLNNSYLLK